MRSNHEELILRNPAFGACALWQVARSFTDKRSGQSPSPSLLHFAISTAMLFHEATVTKIYRMNLESGLLKAVVEEPELVAGLQRRLEKSFPTCLLALQLAVSAEIMTRSSGSGLPAFSAVGSTLPAGIRHSTPTNAAAKRLGNWLAMEDLEIVRARLGIRF
ncbi:DUF6521 family protein [Novosphingobium resinovorum]|uniref:three component ABC system middle component n=1 Tax=Novosphingobium TaxID=165696 RepID=UPI001B3C63C4|nr:MULTISPECIES: three component ABC system middle component [Novosphingobium]MBF7013720.1 hypothetical protein [Novosphingobium sp. HR1a]WJM25862.1 DUF6521 family protein [Novosphingobium resinovorum]